MRNCNGWEWRYVQEWFWTQVSVAALIAWMEHHRGIRTDFDWCRLP